MAEAPSTATLQCPVDTCTETITVELELTLDDDRDLGVHVTRLTDAAAAHVQAQHPELLSNVPQSSVRPE